MKNNFKIVLFVCFFLACLCVGKPVFAQKYNPSIAIMLPEHTTSDKDMRTTIDSVGNIIKKNLQEKSKITEMPDDMPLSLKRSLQNLTVSPTLFDFHVSTSLQITQKLYEGFAEGVHKDSLLMFVVAQKTTDKIDELRKIAEQEQVKHIIGISETHYSFVQGEVKIRIKAFLYEQAKGEIVFNREYNNESKFEANKDEKKEWQLNRAMGNVCLQFGRDVYQTILPTIPNFKKPEDIRQERKKLEQSREKYLIENIHQTEPNEEIWSIIQKNIKYLYFHKMHQGNDRDTLARYYQGFFDKNKQKLIGIIWREQKAWASNEGDVVQINFDIIAGVLYQGRWYLDAVTSLRELGQNHFNKAKYDLETAKKIYLMNLMNYGFFKDKSAEPNPDFWESGFFTKREADFSEEIEILNKKIAKLEKESGNFSRLKSLKQQIRRLKKQEKKNAPYDGLYDIVIEGMQDFKKGKDTLFYVEEEDYRALEAKRDSTYKFWNSLNLNGKKLPISISKNATKIMRIDYYIRSANSEKGCYLQPQIITNKEGKEFLCFFLFDMRNENKVYLWTYFPSELLPQTQEDEENRPKNPYNKYSPRIEEAIDKKIVQLHKNWIDDEEAITDETFWQEYVFKQKSGKYLYLEQVLPAKK